MSFTWEAALGGRKLTKTELRLLQQADQLDSDPWLLLSWRGRTREQVLDLLAAGRSTGAHGARNDGLPAWWPLVPGGGERPHRQQPLSIPFHRSTGARSPGASSTRVA